MHLILTGATGLVGSACLQHMLVTQSITKVSVLSRRPVPQAEGKEKVEVIIHKDFTKYPPDVLEKLQGAEGCVWALGVSYNDVDKVEYEKITVEYPLAAAKAFASLSKPFKIVYVSGEGATTTPGFLANNLQPFGPIKGRAEAALLELSKTTPGFKPYSLRPGGVDSHAHTEIHPYIPPATALSKRVAEMLLPALRITMKSMISPTRDLARVLVDLAMGDGEPLEGNGILGEGRTISNPGMRRLAGI